MRRTGPASTDRDCGNDAVEKSKRTAISVRDFQARQTVPERGVLRAPTPLGNGLLAICNEVRALEARTTETELQNRYKIGEIIRGVEQDARYGQQGVERLAEALGHHKSTLHRAARIFEGWPGAAFRDLAVRTGRDGHRISWSHLEKLVSVADKARRDELIERIFDEKLSVKDLERSMRARTFGAREKVSMGHERGVREISAAAAAAQDRLARAGQALDKADLLVADAADIADAIARLDGLAAAVAELQKKLIPAGAKPRGRALVVDGQSVVPATRTRLLGRPDNHPTGDPQ